MIITVFMSDMHLRDLESGTYTSIIEKLNAKPTTAAVDLAARNVSVSKGGNIYIDNLRKSSDRQKRLTRKFNADYVINGEVLAGVYYSAIVNGEQRFYLELVVDCGIILPIETNLLGGQPPMLKIGDYVEAHLIIEAYCFQESTAFSSAVGCTICKAIPITSRHGVFLDIEISRMDSYRINYEKLEKYKYLMIGK